MLDSAGMPELDAETKPPRRFWARLRLFLLFYCVGTATERPLRARRFGHAVAATCAVFRSLGVSASAALRCKTLCYAVFAALLLWSANPQQCRAEDDTPSIVGYAFSGLGTGLATGLAIGYLSTGPEFHSNEWRKLGWGTAIGGLAGLGTGLLLGIGDAASGRPRSYGFYMVRDSSYGFMVGAVAGGIIGSIIWLGDGTPKDLLRGLAWGTVIGAGTGLLLGVLEAALRNSSGSNPKPSSTDSSIDTEAASRPRVQFALGFMPTASGAPVPYPSLTGRF